MGIDLGSLSRNRNTTSVGGGGGVGGEEAGRRREVGGGHIPKLQVLATDPKRPNLKNCAGPIQTDKPEVQ